MGNRGGSKEEERGRGLDREDPAGQGALRAGPLSSFSPSTGGHEAEAKMACWQMGSLLLASEASTTSCLGLSQVYGARWIRLAERKSPCGGRVEETRKPALFPFCSSCQDVGQPLGSAKPVWGGPSGPFGFSSVSAAKNPSSTSQASLIRLRPGNASYPLEVSGSPRGFFLGHARWLLSIQLTQKLPVSAEGQHLWAQGERKLTEGAAGQAKWPRASRRRAPPPG